MDTIDAGDTTITTDFGSLTAFNLATVSSSDLDDVNALQNMDYFTLYTFGGTDTINANNRSSTPIFMQRVEKPENTSSMTTTNQASFVLMKLSCDSSILVQKTTTSRKEFQSTGRQQNLH